MKTANVLDFVEPSDKGDSWPAFCRAQLALDRRGGELIVPPATYRLTKPVFLEDWTRATICDSHFITKGARWSPYFHLANRVLVEQGARDE